MSTICEQLKKKISEFPDSPGVYMFVSASGETLYVGKATSLRDRVKSYFGSDLVATRGKRLIDMVALATDIKIQTTLSVLEALILEANLIKKIQPKYNAKEKDNKSFNYVVITKEEFPQVLTVRGRTLEIVFPKKEIKYNFGPFPSGSSLRIALAIIRRLFPYRDNKCKPNTRACFNRQIGLCPGVCTGEISAEEYAKTIQHIRLFFEGKKKLLVKTLEKEMNEASKNLKFEEAGRIKKLIFSLDHINDVALIKKDVLENDGQNNFRIEAYDIAHMAGKSVVGVMVVVENSEAKRVDYRKFKIRINPGVDDTGALREVLERRFGHPEWVMPDIIVVDGGVAQKNVAESILKKLGLTIPVVGVVKNDKHKPERIIGNEELIKAYEGQILVANSEAHRFAIGYHRKVRQKKVLSL